MPPFAEASGVLAQFYRCPDDRDHDDLLALLTPHDWCIAAMRGDPPSFVRPS